MTQADSLTTVGAVALTASLRVPNLTGVSEALSALRDDLALGLTLTLAIQPDRLHQALRGDTRGVPLSPEEADDVAKVIEEWGTLPVLASTVVDRTVFVAQVRRGSLIGTVDLTGLADLITSGAIGIIAGWITIGQFLWHHVSLNPPIRTGAGWTAKAVGDTLITADGERSITVSELEVRRNPGQVVKEIGKYLDPNQTASRIEYRETRDGEVVVTLERSSRLP